MNVEMRSVGRDFLLGLPIVQMWPEMRRILTQASLRLDRNWQLPLLACEAVGGDSAQAVPAMAAIACLQLSIILVDDLLDADPRGEHQRIGAAAAANIALGLQAAGLEAIDLAEVQPAIRLVALRCLSRAALVTSFGQQLDSQNPADEESYWKVVETKSAPFFAAAFEIGALLGGASPEVATQLRQFGSLYGQMIQIYDDLRDAMAVPASPDWTLGRSPLPILFAQVVDYVERARFIELRRAIPDPAALAEAQDIMIRCGAVSYSIYQFLRRHEQARQTLHSIDLQRERGLAGLLEDLLKPTRKLFDAVAARPPSLFNEASSETTD